MSPLTTYWHEFEKDNWVHIREWESINDTRGIIHILHGMMEHSGYYHDWAVELTKLGWTVVSHDHPGSGFTVMKECGNDHLPFDGKDKLCLVTQIVDHWIRKKYSNKKVIRYGHSMGAFVALNSFLTGNEVDGIILTGTSFEKSFVLNLQKYFIKMLAKVYKTSSTAKIADLITFLPLNQKFKQTKTKYDWITRNKDALNKYINDPLCGNVVSWGYFYSLNELLLTCINEKKWKAVKYLPKSLILTGEFDALSNFGKKISSYIMQNEPCFKNTKTITIPGSRHKIEYDQNQHLVISEISNFLEGFYEH